MKKLSAVFLAIAFCTTLIFSGCGQKSQQTSSEKNTIEIKDSKGKAVTVPRGPKRVVVMNNAVAEIICALGEEDKIIGVSNKAHFPEGLKKKDKVGESFTPSIEKILELKPDIVFGYGEYIKNETVEKMKSAGIVFVSIDCYKVKTLGNDIKTLGTIFDKKEKAEEYVQLMDKYLNMVKERVEKLKPEEKVKVYWEGYSEYKTVAKGAGGDELVNMAGGANIAAGEPVPFPQISNEWIIEKNPNVVLKQATTTIASGYGITDESGLKQLNDKMLSRVGWNNISAVKDGKVYVLSNEISTGARGVIGVCYLAKAFYPDLFKDLDPAAVHKDMLKKFQGLDYKGIWIYPEK